MDVGVPGGSTVRHGCGCSWNKEVLRGKRVWAERTKGIVKFHTAYGYFVRGRVRRVLIPNIGCVQPIRATGRRPVRDPFYWDVRSSRATPVSFSRGDGERCHAPPARGSFLSSNGGGFPNEKIDEYHLTGGQTVRGKCVSVAGDAGRCSSRLESSVGNACCYSSVLKPGAPV